MAFEHDLEQWRAAKGWTIWPDQRITRRKLFHIVLTPSGSIAFRSRLLWECIEFLDAFDISAYELRWDSADNPLLICRTMEEKER